MAITEQGAQGVSALLAPDRPSSTPPGAPPEGPGEGPPGGGSPRRKRRGRLVVGIAVALVVGLVVAAGALWTAAPSVGHLGDPFGGVPAASRATADPAAAGATNILVIGSDSRAAGETGGEGADAGEAADWTRGGQRSDVLMLVHLAADGRTAQVVSIPRDSWVPVPGYGTTKINAAFSYGGAGLAVQTVEQLTGVRVDHVVAVDFTGFARVTDALGGVRICVPKTTTDAIGTVAAGCSTMDGQQALEYVRQRKTLAGGDFDRQRRQQNWMRAVLTGLTERDLLTDPGRLSAVVDELAGSVRTDDGLGGTQLVALALGHRDLRADGVTFLTAPLADPATGDESGQSVVHLDPVAGADLWQAVRSDDVGTWLAAHPDSGLGDTVR